MEEIQEIVTANFNDVNELLNKNYICVSVVGKVYGEYDGVNEIKRITNLNTFRHYYHIRAKDWYACNLLYRDILDKKGIDKLKEDLSKLTIDSSKTKIALCGYGKNSDFCFRHIIGDYLNSNGISVIDIHKNELSIQKSLWKRNLYKEQGHSNNNDKFVGKTLENSNWVFAKTLPKNPHFYILRKDFNNDKLFLELVSHIRFYGTDEIYEGVLYRVFYFKNYKYWDHPCDQKNSDVDLINRCLI
jgi:hypothetical protein